MAVTGTGTGVFNFSASGDTLSTIVMLDSCRWVGTSTGAAGDTCIVNILGASSSSLLWRSVADGANFIDGWVFDYKSVPGISIATMQSGTFQLYEARK